MRGEDERGKFDFVVSRAVMPLPDLMKIVRKNIAPDQHNSLPNGLLVLKGGNVQEEVKPFRRIAQTEAVKQWFEELWFDEKYIIYIPIG